jgi:Ring finger domain
MSMILFYQNFIIYTNYIYYSVSLIGEILRTFINLNLISRPDIPECDFTRGEIAVSFAFYMLSSPFRIYNVLMMMTRPDIPDFLKYNIMINAVYLLIYGSIEKEPMCSYIDTLVSADLAFTFMFTFCQMVLYFTLEVMYIRLDMALNAEEQRRRREMLNVYTVINAHQIETINEPKTVIQLREEACPIGLDPFEVGERVVVLSCEHQFKEKNLNLWLNVRMRCPLCNNYIRVNNIRV